MKNFSALSLHWLRLGVLAAGLTACQTVSPPTLLPPTQVPPSLTAPPAGNAEQAIPLEALPRTPTLRPGETPLMVIATNAPGSTEPAPTLGFTPTPADYSQLPLPEQGWQLGPADARFTIVEYGDYQ